MASVTKPLNTEDVKMKGITNAQANALTDASYADDTLTLTWADGSTKAVTIEGGGEQFTLKVTVSGPSDKSGITITATPTGSIGSIVQGATGPDGVAYLTVKQNGTYKVTASKSGYVFTTSPTVTCAELTTEASISGYVPGSLTVTVTDEKASVVGRKVTITKGSTTKNATISSGSSVTFTGLEAGTWTVTCDYPSGATGADSKTVSVSNGSTATVTIAINYVSVYGCRIAVATSDPSTRVTYPQTIFGQTNKAYGKAPASGTGASCMNGWDGCELITGIKRQTTANNGSTWTDVSSKTASAAGSSSQQVFTYFPTWWFKMTNDGTNIDLAFSNKQIDDTWKDYAGSVGTNRVGHFRLGCYACKSDFKSYAGTPKVSTSLSDFIAGAKALRTGMDIMTWYQWTYLGALATLLYKSTNLQSAMAQGYVDNSSMQSESALTFSNNYGMSGGTSTTQQMAFFWIQNLWGNMWQWCGGAKTDPSYKLMTCTGYSSTSDSDFDKKSLGEPSSNLTGGYISKVVGTTDAGFFPTEISGSATTYFADRGFVGSSFFPYVGGNYDRGDIAGPFCASFGNSASGTYSYLGSRLSYRL